MSFRSAAKTSKQKCANPVFEEWLVELRDDAVARDLQSKHTFTKCLNALRRYPLPLRRFVYYLKHQFKLFIEFSALYYYEILKWQRMYDFGRLRRQDMQISRRKNCKIWWSSSSGRRRSNIWNADFDSEQVYNSFSPLGFGWPDHVLFQINEFNKIQKNNENKKSRIQKSAGRRPTRNSRRWPRQRLWNRSTKSTMWFYK